MSTSFGWEAKAGMVHFDSGWTRGVQVKLWDPLRTRAIPERLGVFTTRRYTNPRVYLYVLYHIYIYHSRTIGLLWIMHWRKNYRGHSMKLIKHRCKSEDPRHFFLRGLSSAGTCWITTPYEDSYGFKTKLEKERSKKMGLFLDWSRLGPEAVLPMEATAGPVSYVVSILGIAEFIVFSERELMFTFAICRRPSVCRLSSVTFVHPITQAIELFGNVSMPFGTLAICDPSVKILRRSSQGNPSVVGLNQRGVEKCSDFGPFQGYISETVQDRR